MGSCCFYQRILIHRVWRTQVCYDWPECHRVTRYQTRSKLDCCLIFCCCCLWCCFYLSWVWYCQDRLRFESTFGLTIAVVIFHFSPGKNKNRFYYYHLFIYSFKFLNNISSDWYHNLKKNINDFYLFQFFSHFIIYYKLLLAQSTALLPTLKKAKAMPRWLFMCCHNHKYL